MKKFFVAAFLSVSVLGLSAQEIESDDLLKVNVDARIDYQRDWNDWHTVKSNTGFEGRYLNIRIDGSIIPNLTYSWRQRLNKEHSDRSFFDATDWVYLNYDFRGWAFSAGKQIVCIGGYEYDRAPMDLYGCSVFWNNIPCYQIGGSVGYEITKKDRLIFQFCESPFFTSHNRDMYAYNLMWSGNHGIFSGLYSLNLMEYLPGRYISYIALGNQFTFNKFRFQLDLMNRAAGHQAFFFKDCSVMAELSYSPTDRWRIHGKFTYDVNKSGTGADLTVADGTDLKMIGGGVEFFPLKKKKTSLRIHANMYYSWGLNANTADVMHNESAVLSVGVKWDMDILSLKRMKKSDPSE